MLGLGVGLGLGIGVRVRVGRQELGLDYRSHVPQRAHGVGAVGAVGATGTMELLLPSALWVRSGASPSNKYDRSLKSSLLSV